MKRCGICNSGNLVEFASFGKMPVANAFLRKEDLDKPEFSYNMGIGFCMECKMTQLTEVVPYNKYIVPDASGKTNYAFFSSTSKVMEQHFAELAEEVEERFLDADSKVLEIGSNDGIMLKAFKNSRNVLGIEPSTNVAEVAWANDIPTLNEFFSGKLAKGLASGQGKRRVVLSTNVFLNIIDVHDFMSGIREVIDDKGVFITEDPYIGNILAGNSYDQIYDEHVWYFSLASLSNLFKMHGMEIFDAQKQEVHGGSMRVYACKTGAYDKTGRLETCIKDEKRMALESVRPYLQFAIDVRKNKADLAALLKGLKDGGKRIVGYAAASKGTIVLNYCGIGKETLDYISDSTPYKQGLYSPGMHIPVVSPDVFHADKTVDFALLGAWNHAKEIIGKEKEFLERGGRFITHLPTPHIV